MTDPLPLSSRAQRGIPLGSGYQSIREARDSVQAITRRRNGSLGKSAGLRPTLPRHLYLKLVAKASAAVKERLEAAHPEHAEDIPSAVREATRRAHSTPVAVT